LSRVKHYPHISRFGEDKIKDIVIGECHIFPKIDGTFGEVVKDWDGRIRMFNKYRELSLEEDNQGFVEHILKQKNIIEFLDKYPTLQLFGEFLIIHTLETYREDSLNKFYVFDVYENNKPLHYDAYKPLLEEFNINYIPCLCTIKSPTLQSLIQLCERNTYLLKDGYGVGEGLVIKNYNFKDRNGRYRNGKIVRNEFKEGLNRRSCGEVIPKSVVEQRIVDKYVTESFVNKEWAKLSVGVDESKHKGAIHRLIDTIFYTLIEEEIWNIVKYFKHPTVDFSLLKHLTIFKIKETLPYLFDE